MSVALAQRITDSSCRAVQEPRVDDSKAKGKYSVPALDKALDVIELLAENATSMSQIEIARALDKSPGEIFRTLSALEERRYIRRTEAGQYRLTLRLFELSRMHSPYDELLRVALPIMRSLSEEVGETCHLSTLRHGEVVVLAQHESPNPVRLSIEVGSRHSPLNTTSGRLFLAGMSEKNCRLFLDNYTDFAERPQDVRDALLNRVGTIALRGYEVSDGERFVGGFDVGTLVGDGSSTLSATLVIATLRNADGPDQDALVEAVQRYGNQISEALGLL